MASSARMLMVLPFRTGLAGCGTLSSFPDQVYGGVLRDTATIKAELQNVVYPEGSEGRLASLAGAGYFALFDFPVSAVGDTVTLPWTITAAMKNKAPPTRLEYD